MSLRDKYTCDEKKRENIKKKILNSEAHILWIPRSAYLLSKSNKKKVDFCPVFTRQPAFQLLLSNQITISIIHHNDCEKSEQKKTTLLISPLFLFTDLSLLEENHFFLFLLVWNHISKSDSQSHIHHFGFYWSFRV